MPSSGPRTCPAKDSRLLTMNAGVGVEAQPTAVCPGGPGGIPLGPSGLPPVRGHPRGLHTGRPVAGRGAGDPIRALRSGE